MAAKRFCPECGEDVSDDQRYCRSCGFDLGNLQEPGKQARSGGRNGASQKTWVTIGLGAGALVVVALALILVTGVFSKDSGDSVGTVPLSEIQSGVDAESSQPGGFFDEPADESGGSNSGGQGSGSSNPSTTTDSTFEATGPPANSYTQTFSTGIHDCPGGGGLMVGPDTSCGFAQQVLHAYSQAPQSQRSQPKQVYSPTTGKYYTMRCSGKKPVECRGGNDASVYLTKQ